MKFTFLFKAALRTFSWDRMVVLGFTSVDSKFLDSSSTDSLFFITEDLSVVTIFRFLLERSYSLLFCFKSRSSLISSGEFARFYPFEMPFNEEWK